MGGRGIRRAVPLAAAVATALAASACTGADETAPQAAPPAGPTAPGSIAFIDRDRCISVIPAAGGDVDQYCPKTRTGVASLTWLDASTVAFVTEERLRAGWSGYDINTGVETVLTLAESPRIVQAGVPQFYSIEGERVEAGPGGEVIRTSSDGASSVTVLTPALAGSDGLLALATWSPDGDWLLLRQGTEKALWVVSEDGESPHRIAGESRGAVSWFIPSAGAMPHADLTCTLPTPATYLCQPLLRAPADAATARLADGWLPLTWSLCPGATGYQLEVTTGGGAQPVVTHVSAATAYRFVAPAAGTYAWRVRPLIGESPGPWSETRTVTIG